MKYKISSTNDSDTEIYEALKAIIRAFFRKFGKFDAQTAQKLVDMLPEKQISTEKMRHLCFRILWFMDEKDHVPEKIAKYINEIKQ